ncbi:MAG: glycoside hydrolase family 18 protein [Pseudomonadota bacterium]
MPKLKRLTPLLAALALLGACAFETADVDTATVASERQRFEVIAYYHGTGDGIERYAIEDLTQLIYSFAQLQGNVLDIEPHDSKLRRLVKLKERNPSLKVLLAFGGWGGCETCSEVFSVAEDRAAFADSVLRVLQEYELDGIDLDWEFPAVPGFPGHAYKPEDRENFTALIEVLRSRLGTRFEISFAAAATPAFMQRSIDWARVMPLVDRVNVMSYDFVAGGSTSTGHHTALYAGPNNALSADTAVSGLIELGVPPGKIVLGGAFYARVWRDVEVPEDSALGVPGVFHESVAYRDFDRYFGSDCKAFWDERAAAPYRYCRTAGLFATYDNRRSIAEKTRYAAERSLAGIMFWQLAQDSERDGLLSAVAEVVRETESE